MGVEGCLASLPEVEFQRMGDLVEEDFRKNVKTLDLQVDQDCESDALVVESHRVRGTRVRSRQDTVLKRLRILEQLPAGVLVSPENHIEKCGVPGDLGERHCEPVVVFVREASPLRSYELAQFGHFVGGSASAAPSSPRNTVIHGRQVASSNFQAS